MATTIPVSDDTKELFDEHKTSDFKNWDVFMQHVIETYESGNGGGEPMQSDIDVEELVDRISDELDITVEVSEDEKTASVLVDRLMQRLKGIDEDVRNAAYEGSKEAIEEVAR